MGRPQGRDVSTIGDSPYCVRPNTLAALKSDDGFLSVPDRRRSRNLEITHVWSPPSTLLTSPAQASSCSRVIASGGAELAPLGVSTRGRVRLVRRLNRSEEGGADRKTT